MRPVHDASQRPRSGSLVLSLLIVAVCSAAQSAPPPGSAASSSDPPASASAPPIAIDSAPALRGDERAGVRRCSLAVELDPATGRLVGDAVVELSELSQFLTPAGDLPIALDARLELAAAEIDGVAVGAERLADPAATAHASTRRASWSIDLPHGAESGGALGVVPPRIALRWSGVLRDDVAAGEAPGRIHNTSMRAHVGEQGIYLSPEAAWHPLLDTSRAAGWSGPDAPLCEWTVELSAPVAVVASGDRVTDRATPPSPDASVPAPAALVTTWRTPFPQPAVAVAGGPLRSFERAHGATTVRALLRPSSERHADSLLAAVASYLDLYQPLLGPYPFRDFTIVENFFSSGFAFPGFTLLSSEVIRMGERGLRPGYLDHELLHGWWGHGVLASRSSGHWAEALASYCANYMRPVLEGRSEQARAQRRSVSETLSGSPALAGQAVGDFGLDGGVSSFVGYQKGAMVFDQLAARIGQESLWAGLRRFFHDRVGRPSGWDDLRAAFEAESGLDLSTFFSFWVAGPGLPSPRVEHAVWDGATSQVRLDVAYSDPVTIDLPLRLRFEGSALQAPTRTERLTIHPGDATLRFESPQRPVAIDIDPEFETLRRLPPELLMPTLSGLAPPLDLALVGVADDLEGYAIVASALAQRYGKAKSGRLVRSERFAPELLGAGHVLALGRAALDAELLRLFAPEGIEVWASGFAVAPVRYVSPGDAVLACVRNPSRAGAFVCLFWGNDDEALERADLLPFYGGNSLLVFDRGQPWKRRDFEAIERVEVR